MECRQHLIAADSALVHSNTLMLRAINEIDSLEYRTKQLEDSLTECRSKKNYIIESRRTKDF